MTGHKKPDSYTEADWEMVQGYMRGIENKPMEKETAAYKHGWLNGQDDFVAPREIVQMS